MESLGYIKDVEGAVTRLGGKLLERIPIHNVSNPLNPTACYVILPPSLPPTPTMPSSDLQGHNKRSASNLFSVPGTGLSLTEKKRLFHVRSHGSVLSRLEGHPGSSLQHGDPCFLLFRMN